MMKQNSPNCLLCPNENFPSKTFYLNHLREKHILPVNVMLCVCCGVTSNVYEIVARHQLKCFKKLIEEADHCCPHCDAHFYSENDHQNPFFISHMNLEHREIIKDTWSQCSDCKSYVPPESVQFHKDTHCLWKLRSTKREEITHFPLVTAKKPRLGQVCH